MKLLDSFNCKGHDLNEILSQKSIFQVKQQIGTTEFFMKPVANGLLVLPSNVTSFLRQTEQNHFGPGMMKPSMDTKVV